MTSDLTALIYSEIVHLTSAVFVQGIGDNLEKKLFTELDVETNNHRIFGALSSAFGPDLDIVTHYAIFKKYGGVKISEFLHQFSYFNGGNSILRKIPEKIQKYFLHRSDLTHSFFPGSLIGMALGGASYSLAGNKLEKSQRTKYALYGALLYGTNWTVSHLIPDMIVGKIHPTMFSEKIIGFSEYVQDFVNLTPGLENNIETFLQTMLVFGLGVAYAATSPKIQSGYRKLKDKLTDSFF